MKTYLLTWNPDRWSWEDIQQDLAQFRKDGHLDGRWSCGNNKSIQKGARAFLMRQHVEPRGIFASGWITRGSRLGQHWEDAKRTALYIRCRWDTFLSPTMGTILTRESLLRGRMANVHWDTPASGIEIKPQQAAELERVWKAFRRSLREVSVALPEEVAKPSLYAEGTTKRITVNTYERDPKARRACVDYYGFNWSVCGFDFANTYGEIGVGFTHVHHLTPLSTVKKGYKVDPLRDLRPVCPNCHAMIHQSREMLSIQQLKRMIHLGKRSLSNRD